MREAPCAACADGGDDVGVGAAAADVAAHAFADLVVGEFGMEGVAGSKETVLRVLCLCSSRSATAEQIWPGVQ